MIGRLRPHDAKPESSRDSIRAVLHVDNDAQGVVVMSGEAFYVTDVAPARDIGVGKFALVNAQVTLLLEHQELFVELSMLNFDRVYAVFEFSDRGDWGGDLELVREGATGRLFWSA